MVKILQPMSAALRERLKKTRRSFSSCLTVAKRLRVDSEEENNIGRPGSSRAIEASSDLSQTGCVEESTAGAQKDALQDVVLCQAKPLVVKESLQNSPHKLSLTVESGQQSLLQERKKLMKEIREKEEILRRLKMVKMYRSKNNLTELQSLIEKWRSSSQSLLYELQTSLSADGKKLSLMALIDSLGLEDTLLHYNRAEEDFTDT
ncbi:swi5-dependent recombination DNA repair protein 1 homolog [Latimeria chalumnae]